MTTRTNTRSDSVHPFFDKPELYLKNTVGIQLRIQLAHQMLGNIEHSHILDVGCGSGAISLTFLSETNRLTLLDFSPKMLEIARSRIPPEFVKHVVLVNSDIHAFPNSELYGVVLCFGVLAHVADPAATIERLANLTQAGGVCILQLTDQASLIAKINRSYHFLRERMHSCYGYRLTAMRFNEIVQLAQENSFRVEAYRRYSAALPGMGHLPVQLFKRIQQLSMQSLLLSSIGSEVILKLRKSE